MLQIHSSLTLSIAISDFLEEMDISESLKCCRHCISILHAAGMQAGILHMTLHGQHYCMGCRQHRQAGWQGGNVMYLAMPWHVVFFFFFCLCRLSKISS